MHDSRMRSFAIALLVLVAAGCTGDDSPPMVSDQEVAIYLVRDGKVAPVRRAIEAEPADLVSATLMSLAAGPNEEERGEGYGTSLPPEEVALVEVEQGTASVDLPEDSAPSALASAQLVHTLTQFPDIDRVVVEGGKPVTRKAFESAAPQILIESPLDGDAVSSPIRLRGTANVFEATVSIEVRDGTGTVVLEAFTTATSGTGTRGTFDTSLVLPASSGTMTITAFESSAKDGKPLHAVDVQVAVAP